MEERENNLNALGKAGLIVFTIFWTIPILLYFPLYKYYPEVCTLDRLPLEGKGGGRWLTVYWQSMERLH